MSVSRTCPGPGTVLDVLREPCQWCGLPVPLGDLMFCRCGCGLVCADKDACGGRIERRITWLKATSAKFRALVGAPAPRACPGPGGQGGKRSEGGAL